MKKQLLTIAIITLSVISLTFADTYTTEIQDAYDYAYSIGITTQPSIDSANMYGSLIRAHMAKMMVNYAEKVLGKTPDYLLPCSFSDISDQSTELKGYIIQACQLGLMGVNIHAFNPNAIVTRAQFGTVLSRALYDDMFNDGDPYYVNHLQALKDATIMTNISNPNAPEVRGYVMLMMMRAGGQIETASSVCDNQQTQLLCLLGSASCPSECQPGNQATIAAGTLTVGSATIAAGSLPAGFKYIGSIKLTATDENITIKTLRFQKVGNVTNGWIEDNGVKIAQITSSASDTTITINLSPNITITQGTPKTLSIFLEGPVGLTQWMTLSSAASIDSSASSVGGTFPQRLSK